MNSEDKSLDLIPEVTDWTGAVRGMFANRPNPPYTEETITLFDNKYRDYTKPALRAESAYSFYDRSSLTGYTHLRQMLQRWVDRLPPNKQKDIVGRMRHRGSGSPKEEQNFNGAFFELFLHEFLNGTGGYTVVDPKIGHLTPDFGVTEAGPDGTPINYVVEATDINIVSGTDLDSHWNEQRALDILDEIESPDFRLSVETEGTLVDMPRKLDLKRPFEELVRTANYDDVRARSELYGFFNGALPETSFRHGNWNITGSLIPLPPERRPRKGRFIGAGPAKAGGVNDIVKPKNRLYDKAKRYREVDNLIIAIRADWWLDRIAEILFGSLAYQISVPKDPTYTGPLPPGRSVQQPDGFWFNTSGPQNENVIGVVAFYDLHPHCVDKTKAIFYANPYTEKPLPSWAKEIAHAEYRDGKIEIVDGVLPCFVVKDYESWKDDWELERQQGAAN